MTRSAKLLANSRNAAATQLKENESGNVSPFLNNRSEHAQGAHSSPQNSLKSRVGALMTANKLAKLIGGLKTAAAEAGTATSNGASPSAMNNVDSRASRATDDGDYQREFKAGVVDLANELKNLTSMNLEDAVYMVEKSKIDAKREISILDAKNERENDELLQMLLEAKKLQKEITAQAQYNAEDARKSSQKAVNDISNEAEREMQEREKIAGEALRLAQLESAALKNELQQVKSDYALLKLKSEGDDEKLRAFNSKKARFAVDLFKKSVII